MPEGLHWYTGSDWDPMAAMDVDDTPHGAPPHKVLFFRGPVWLQGAIFTVHACVALAYTAGWRTRWTSWLLWLATVSLHGRNEFSHDGSDKYFRNLLLWSSFLPLGASFYLPPPRAGKRDPITAAAPTVFTSLGTIGFTLQVALMYLGTIALRWRKDERWFDGTAVYWSIRGSFAARPPSFLPSYPTLCALLTHMGVVMEIACALVLLSTTVKMTRARTFSVLIIVATHVGIAIMFYLPQWQSLAAGVSLTFLPSGLLDLVFGPPAPLPIDPGTKTGTEGTAASASYSMGVPGSCSTGLRTRHRGGDPAASATDGTAFPSAAPSTQEAARQSRSTGHTGRRPLRPWSKPKLAVAGFLLCYMLYQWGATDAGLYKAVDDGDIGQILRFYQGWVMFVGYKGSGTRDTFVRITATLHPKTGDDIVYDVLAGLRTGAWQPLGRQDLERLEEKPACCSCEYPSWRYERYVSQFPSKSWTSVDRSFSHLAAFYCSKASSIARSPSVGGSIELATPPVVRMKAYSYVVNDPEGDGVEPTFGTPRQLNEWARDCAL